MKSAEELEKGTEVSSGDEPDSPMSVNYYENVENIKAEVRSYKFWDIGCGSVRLLQINPIVFFLGTFIMWGFVIASLVAPCETNSFYSFGGLMTWISMNFGWFYIGTNDAWAVFVMWLYFSKYSSMKLGRDDEKPEYDFFSYFCMQFTCGVAVGMYTYGVNEPMYYYRGAGKLFKTPMNNDDDRAQQAMTITFFHWGAHAYVVYTLVAIAMGISSFRRGKPMTFKMAFYPLLGNHINSFLGDLIDGVAIAATTFGVCTSLGLGVTTMDSVMHRLTCPWVNENQPECTYTQGTNTQIGIIVVLTCLATVSVCLGVRWGINTLSIVAIIFGLLYMIITIFADNTWILLNVLVQTIGHYIQYVIALGFNLDAFSQIAFEINGGGAKFDTFWGNEVPVLQSFRDDAAVGEGPFAISTSGLAITADTLLADVVEHGCNSNGDDMLSPGHYGGYPWFMDYWTIFYWGWWISWAPFVGMFIAKISRGRTIAQVIEVSFFVSISFIFLWMGVMGAAGIREQRIAEVALGLVPNYLDGSFTEGSCGEHYYTGSETTNEYNLWDENWTGRCFESQPDLVPLVDFDACDVMQHTGINLVTAVDEFREKETDATNSGVFGATLYTLNFDKHEVEDGFISMADYMDNKELDGTICASQGCWIRDRGTNFIPLRVASNVSMCDAGIMDEDGHRQCNGDPSSAKSKALWHEKGVVVLSCRPGSGQAMDVLSQYAPEGNLRVFLLLIYGIGLALYFTTSSDSGSWCDDTNSAAGLLKPPVFQKIYWCWTEGITAICLLLAGEDQALKAIRGVSIVAGLPWTFALCFMCTAVYRGVKQEMGELPGPDSENRAFKTSHLDVFEGFRPCNSQGINAGERIVSAIKALVAPFHAVFVIAKHQRGNNRWVALSALAVTFSAEIVFIALHACVGLDPLYSVLAWVFGYLPIVSIVFLLRVNYRATYNIVGSLAEDFCGALVWYPFILSQMELEVKLRQQLGEEDVQSPQSASKEL